MAEFKVESKNKVEIEKKPRVYFTCHPQDFDHYFKKICEDIFATHDCAIYYTPNMEETIAKADLPSDLGRSNLLVVPVTYGLLTKPSRAMNVDIPYALSSGLPVLPIMVEPNLDALYAHSDKFDKIQYLRCCSTDTTEIPYAEKLKKYLESILIGDELAKRIRTAFDAHIFLSYRKKDRRYANELMRLIHSNPECRSIAIWFDEFLTPGESFKESIETMLNDCNLFTLLVTPRLLEKVIDERGKEQDNYVLAVELPMARKNREEKGTDIFAVEMEHTEKAALSAIQIEDYVNCRDAAFRSRLLESVTRIAAEPSDAPAHNYLIGLAYRDGIDVEVNRQQALELITSAAKANLPEAMLELSYMYQKGIGVTVNCSKALEWMQQLMEYEKTKHGENHAETLVCLYAMASIYADAGDFQKACEVSEKTYKLRHKALGEENPDTLSSLSQLAAICLKTGEYLQAQNLAEKLYHLRCAILGKKHPDTLGSLNNLAHCYENLQNYTKAIELEEAAYKLSCELLGEEHPDTLTALNSLGYFYQNTDKDAAFKLGEKAYRLRCKVLGEDHPATLRSLHNLSAAYGLLGDSVNALKAEERAYRRSLATQGPNHPNTSLFRACLSGRYLIAGDFENAQKVFEEGKKLEKK